MGLVLIAEDEEAMLELFGPISSSATT